MSINLRYDERINPLVLSGQIGAFSLRHATTDELIPITMAQSDDGRGITITPQKLLEDNSRYYLDGYGVEEDIAANNDAATVFREIYFYTSTILESESIKLISQSIGDGLIDVPLDGQMWFAFDQQLGIECVNTSTVTMVESATGINIEGTIEFDNSNTYIGFNPVNSLSANTEYTLTLDGVCDVAGNVVATTSTQYTTGTEIADTTRPTLLSIDPTNNMTGVGVDSPIILTFSEAIRIDKLSNIEISVDNSRIAGNYVVNEEQTEVTFTPDNSLPANTEIETYMSSNSMLDLTGNTGTTITRYFTTALEGADTVAPTVISITPNDNAVDINTTSDVVMTFSESLDSTSEQPDRSGCYK